VDNDVEENDVEGDDDQLGENIGGSGMIASGEESLEEGVQREQTERVNGSPMLAFPHLVSVLMRL
jgi:hypothetical protein